MNTVKILSLPLLSAIVLISCKNAEETNSISAIDPINDIALAEVETIETTSDIFLYVTAYSGLTLREYSNLQSEKLAIMPYGTKVKVISVEKNPTMTVGGIKGGMNHIEFNHKKGFAFNGYLSKFFPPEVDITAKGYAEDLQLLFPEVVFTETNGGIASKPTNTETLILPTNQWHEAFYIAQQLFEFPSEFYFPSQKGKDSQIIKDSKPKRDVWVSELHITRKDNVLSKIEYIYKTTKGFTSNLSITKEGEAMKISKTEIVE